MAFESLTDPCLPDLFTDIYPAMPGAIMMMSMFALFVIEMWLTAKTGGHSHGGATGEIEHPHPPMNAHNMHQMNQHAKLVNQRGKPEAYYFPPQYNFKSNNFPYTFMGLEPGTTRNDVIDCLKRWNQGDNGILDLSKAYKLVPGTGWQVDAGILHVLEQAVDQQVELAVVRIDAGVAACVGGLPLQGAGEGILPG